MIKINTTITIQEIEEPKEEKEAEGNDDNNEEQENKKKFCIAYVNACFTSIFIHFIKI